MPRHRRIVRRASCWWAIPLLPTRRGGGWASSDSSRTAQSVSTPPPAVAVPRALSTRAGREQALALKGDYYLIQFGHNDEPGRVPERETDPNTTYREFMTSYVDATRAIGAKPILVISFVRRQWDKSGSGKIDSSLTPYVEVVKQIAQEKNAPLVDLHARSKELCEERGKEKCYEFSPLKGTYEIDNTHLNATGSVIFARLVIEELVRAVPELKPCLRSEPLPDSTKETARVFDVQQFGAKGESKTLDTAVQRALDECGKTGGIVRQTAGTHLSKPIFLRGNTTLQLDEGAALQAADDPDDSQDVAFVNGGMLSGVAITGKGTIDGAGARWWGPAKEYKRDSMPEPRRRPPLVLVTGCVGVRVRDVTLANSPSFHLVTRDCEDVDIDGVTIRAPLMPVPPAMSGFPNVSSMSAATTSRSSLATPTRRTLTRRAKTLPSAIACFCMGPEFPSAPRPRAGSEM